MCGSDAARRLRRDRGRAMKPDPLSPAAVGIDPVTTVKKLAHKDGGLREVPISLARVNFGEAATDTTLPKMDLRASRQIGAKLSRGKHG